MSFVEPKVKVYKPNYNSFDLSFNTMVSSNFGELKNVLFKHFFAGERVDVGIEHYTKFAPMLAPVFQRYKIRFDTFVCPERILWKTTYDFYRGGKNSQQDFPIPAISYHDLYYLVAYCQVYGIFHDFNQSANNNAVVSPNPWMNSILDDLNLPTFSDVLQGLREAAAAANTTLIPYLENWFHSTYGASEVRSSYPFYVTSTNASLNSQYEIRQLFALYVLYQIEQDNIVFTDRSAGSDWKDEVFPLVPLMVVPSIWREYYRNPFVDDDLTQNATLGDNVPYLPECDASELQTFIQGITPLMITNEWYTYNRTTTAYKSGDWSTWSQYVYLDTLWNFVNCLFGKYNVNFTKDYFTSASIDSQIGPVVQLPLGSLPVIGSNPDTGAVTNIALAAGVSNSRVGIGVGSYVPGSGDIRAINGPNTGTIPDLRNANTLQVLQEKIALAGNRVYDWFKLVFGHEVSDARLQRPTFISRTSADLSISEITQTSAGSGGQPLGDFAGRASSFARDGLGSIQVDEPSYVVVLMSILPHQSYFQGVPKEFLKMDRFDFLIPDFASIGMQPISSRELFVADDNSSVNVFGYTDRYQDYKMNMDEIHGDFRDSMAYFHSSRMFDSCPELNSAFIRCNSWSSDLNRVFAVTSGLTSHIFSYLHFNVTGYRPLPIYPNYAL